ncbi:hypothetical protein BKA81DRAFT_105577 [Phyllosticta paracitricarpa]
MHRCCSTLMPGYLRVLHSPIALKQPKDEKKKRLHKNQNLAQLQPSRLEAHAVARSIGTDSQPDRVASRHPLIVPAIVTTCELATVIDGTAAEPNWDPEVYCCPQPVSRTPSSSRPLHTTTLSIPPTRPQDNILATYICVRPCFRYWAVYRLDASPSSKSAKEHFP